MDHEWTDESEKPLIKWAEQAQTYKWMYSQKEINVYEHIALIAAAINAGINFTITLLPEKEQKYSLFITGILNIIALVITAIYKILTSERIPVEQRIAALAWDRLQRSIRIELSRMRDNRENYGSFVRLKHEEYDRLLECSPSLSDKVIKKYKEAVKKAEEKKKKENDV